MATIADTITSELSPSENYTQRPTLTVRNVSDRRLLTNLQVRGLLDRDGAQVSSVFIRLFPTDSFASSTFTTKRLLSDWSPSTIRWNNQPNGGAATSFTQAGVKEQPFDIDITAYATAWLNGTLPNHGIRFETTSTAAAGRSFYSVNASGTKAQFRPQVILNVTYPPEVPSSINPSNGGVVSTANPLATWRYGGEGVAPMLGYQLQTSLTSGGFGTPASDVTVPDATQPQHQFTGVSGELWFRVRHTSSDGRQSPWSDPQSFTVAARGSVTITSTESVVDEPTPTSTWTFSGTQVAFRVILRRADTGAVVADSGVVAGDDGQWAPSKPVSVPSGVGVNREVRVWDDVERVATPGEPVYAVATNGPFTIEPSGTVDPFTSLSVSRTPASPAVTVECERATTPDGIIFERSIDDGPWVRFPVEPGDVAVGGGLFRWLDVTAPAEHELTYRVRPLVNGAMGEASAEDSLRLRPDFIWLADPDDPEWVLPIAGNDAGSWTLGEDSSIVNVLGSDRANLVHEGFRGYEGSVSGVFVSGIPALGDGTAQDFRDRAWRLKRQPTNVWRLVIGDMNIPVVVRNVNPTPRPGGQTSFGVSLEFYQQGSLPWEED